jgi:hypothetical protein
MTREVGFGSKRLTVELARRQLQPNYRTFQGKSGMSNRGGSKPRVSGTE